MDSDVESLHALILAGGKGERLYPITSHTPKPMIRVAGIPILERQIFWLKSYGIHDITLCIAHLKGKIKEYFKDSVSYSEEETPLDTGGGVRFAWQKRPEDAVIVVNGDILTDLNLRDLARFHFDSKADATLALVRAKLPYGVARLENDSRIVGFDEKPDLPYFINAGVYILNPDCLKYFPDAASSIEYDVFPKIIQEKRVCGYRWSGLWLSIDSFKDYQAADDFVRHMKVP